MSPSPANTILAQESCELPADEPLYCHRDKQSGSSGELSSLLSAIIIIECKKRDKNKDGETEEAKSQVGPCLVKEGHKTHARRARQGSRWWRSDRLQLVACASQALSNKVKEVGKGTRRRRMKVDTRNQFSQTERLTIRPSSMGELTPAIDRQ